MANIPVAIQMYTLRDVAETDYIGTLKKVAEIGYAGVELAGFTIPAEDVKKALGDLGLKAISTHAGYTELVENIQPTIDLALMMGCEYVTCSGVFGDQGRSAEGMIKAAEELTTAGGELAKHGIQLCYHNHAHEFVKYGDDYGYDILFANSNPKYLQAQIDVYWVQFGKEDPVKYIKKYAGRCPLIHLKDMTAGEEPTYAEVGEGILDWKGIFDASNQAGVKWYIVEQDVCKVSSIDSARISFENLKRMGKA